MIGKKLKSAGLTDAQIDQLVGLIEKNPDFFKKIQNQVEILKKRGIPESAAMMTVIREHQGELQKVLSEGFQK